MTLWSDVTDRHFPASLLGDFLQHKMPLFKTVASKLIQQQKVIRKNYCLSYINLCLQGFNSLQSFSEFFARSLKCKVKFILGGWGVLTCINARKLYLLIETNNVISLVLKVDGLNVDVELYILSDKVA